MQLKWREHETQFVTFSSLLLLGVYLWKVFGQTHPPFAETQSVPFLENHVPFSLFRNVLLPDIGMGLLILGAYFWLSLRVVPQWLWGNMPKDKSWTARGLSVAKKTGIALSQIILLAFVLMVGFVTCEYLRNEFLFRYPGFTLFPHTGYHPQPLLDIHGMMAMVIKGLTLVLLFLFLREGLLAIVARKGKRRDFRIMIANRASRFIGIYLLAIPIGLFSPHFSFILVIIYFSLLSSTVLVFFCLYWIFPMKGEGSFFQPSVLGALLLTSFTSDFPWPVYFVFGPHPFLFLLFWVLQLGIVVPLAWFWYQRERDQILRLRGLEKALVKSRTDLEFLRSQINPHFLFNALNTLYGSALVEGSERTAGGIQKLGDMMRFMLHENNKDFIPIEREIEYLENFIALQKMRLPPLPGISIETDIDKELFDRQIAPMLFIPFVENAFKHGIRLQEKSWILIRLSMDRQFVRLEVRNSIHPAIETDPEKDRSGIGLSNLHARLKLLYPGKFEYFAQREGHEFVARLVLQP